MKKNFLFLISFAASILFAQSGNETLKKIQNKFNSINNFSANFVQRYYNIQGDPVGKSNGKFSYKRKDKFIVELKNQMIVSDGATIWNYEKIQKRVVISYFSEDPTSFSLERYIFEYPDLCRVKLVKNEKLSDDIIIELIPKDENLDIKNVKIWSGPDNLIMKIEVIDMSDMLFSIEFSNIKTDQDLYDSKFTFNPPKGIKIIDLR